MFVSPRMSHYACSLYTSLSLVLHRDQNASWFVRCIYRNQQHAVIAKGSSSRPTCFRCYGRSLRRGERPQKILGIDRGGAGTKFPFTSRLPISLYVAVAL